MSAGSCPRCAKALPEATLRALPQGTTCPFCAAPLKRTPRREPTGAQPSAAPPPTKVPGVPADDGYAAFEMSAPPAPPPAKVPGAPAAAPAKLALPGTTAPPAKVSLPGTTAPVASAKAAPITTAASAQRSSLRQTMVGGISPVTARDLPFDGNSAPGSFSLAPPASAPAPVPAPPARAPEPAVRAVAPAAPTPPARNGAAALARTIAAPAPARTPSVRPSLAPAAGRPARSLTPAQALDLPPPTPSPVLKTPPPAPLAQPPMLVADSDSGPTNVVPPSAPEPAAAEPLLMFPDSDQVIDSVTMTPDAEPEPALGGAFAAPPPAAQFQLAVPADPRRRGMALMAVGMGLAIVAIAVVGFRLLRGPKTSAAPAAPIVAQASPPAEPVAAVVEPVPDEPVPPAKAALAAPVAPSKVAPPATTIAPRPEARPTARAIAETHASERPATEKRAGSSRREAVSHKAKPQRERRAKHARAVAMHQPAAKRATPAPAAPSADPRQPYERGNALLFAGDGKGALAAYREAVKSAPSDPIGFRGLGLAYEQQGEHALAIRALRRYLKLAPDAPDRELIAKRIDKLSKRAKK